MNRHAAILAGQTGKRAAPSVDLHRSKELHDELSRQLASYLDTKTSDAATWRVRCELADRQMAQLAAAISPAVVQGGNPPWTGRQRFVVAFNTREGAVHLPIYAEVTATSKPVVVAVQPLSRLAISVYLPDATPAETSTLFQGESYVSASSGNHAAALDLPGTSFVFAWPFVSGISVAASKRGASVRGACD